MVCTTCSDTGYVPFVKPDGRIIPHAKMVCPECDIYYRRQAFKANHRPDAQPDDFDFACSESWRAYYNGGEQHGVVSPCDESLQLAATPKNGGDQLDDRRCFLDTW